MYIFYSLSLSQTWTYFMLDSKLRVPVQTRSASPLGIPSRGSPSAEIKASPFQLSWTGRKMSKFRRRVPTLSSNRFDPRQCP